MSTAEYVQKHNLAATIEKALTEALASQPENPYDALAAWFAAGGAKTVKKSAPKTKAAPKKTTGATIADSDIVYAAATKADSQSFLPYDKWAEGEQYTKDVRNWCAPPCRHAPGSFSARAEATPASSAS